MKKVLVYILFLHKVQWTIWGSASWEHGGFVKSHLWESRIFLARHIFDPMVKSSCWSQWNLPGNAMAVAWILKMAPQIWIFSWEGWFFELDAKDFIHTQVCIWDMRYPWCIWALTTVYTIVHACFGFQKYLFKWKWNIHELLLPTSSWEEILFLAESLGTRGNE